MPSVRLTDEQLTYLLLILRNSSRPLTTQELVRALQEHAGR